MTQGSTYPEPLGREQGQLDTGVPHIARVYDFWLGGKDNYAVDREVAERIIATGNPVIANARANRAFLGRAVRHLTADQGIRQFLDLGTGLPSADNTHEVAQRIAPEARIVYTDNDPIVLVHARALLSGTAVGSTTYIHADVRDIERILEEARQSLDFSRPVGVIMAGLMHCIPDEDDPAGIVATALAGLSSGSYLALSQPAADINATGMARAATVMDQLMPVKITYRTQEQVARFFEGTELLDPGLVPASQWRPDPGADTAPRSVWAGVGRKP
jgi:S-adenosyl methyltransferase